MSADELPRMVRTKTTELTALDDGRYQIVARLTDTSYGGVWDRDRTGGVVHDFVVTGELAGPDLVITELAVEPIAHPYGRCPAIVPSCRALIGKSLASGWRRTVLSLLGGVSGCTHVTTLLLGLAEVRTSAYFLTMNAQVPYTVQNREDGSWAGAGLDFTPPIVDACHVLTRDGTVIERAIQHNQRER